jgi:hypothetical protein
MGPHVETVSGYDFCKPKRLFFWDDLCQPEKRQRLFILSIKV